MTYCLIKRRNYGEKEESKKGTETKAETRKQ